MAGPRSYHEVLQDAERDRQQLVQAIVAQRQSPLRIGGPYDAPANLYDAANAAVDAFAAEIRDLDLKDAATPGQLKQLESNATTREVQRLVTSLRITCEYLHQLK